MIRFIVEDFVVYGDGCNVVFWSIWYYVVVNLFVSSGIVLFDGYDFVILYFNDELNIGVLECIEDWRVGVVYVCLCYFGFF